MKYDGILDRVKGQLSGKGKIYYEDGSVYGGEMLDGFTHGKGKIVYPSGEVWEGEFDENEKEGKGRMTVRVKDGVECVWEGEYIGGQVYERSSLFSKRI